MLKYLGLVRMTSLRLSLVAKSLDIHLMNVAKVGVIESEAKALPLFASQGLLCCFFR